MPANRPRRQPESNVEVFNLGHYEQMQIDLAIQEAITVNEDLDIEERAVDVETLYALQAVFRSHGTVSVIRTNDDPR